MIVPLISVVVPVYNGAETIRAGIESLLSQSFQDFEIVVVDDGSTDGTAEVVGGINDSRIKLLRQQNRGAAAARNTAIKQSRGEFIAFQDHDDSSTSHRLEKQLSFLRTHTEVGILGSRSVIIDRNGLSRGGHNHPLADEHLRFELMFDNPFVTSSVMLPSRVLKEVGLFTLDSKRFPEDYELWSRISRRFKLANLPDRMICIGNLREACPVLMLRSKSLKSQVRTSHLLWANPPLQRK
ncbi:glycosyltransferase family 2 protein [Roseibium salinum]|uniref:glycosyltransferase family 2 protein n=1 Tax=Roseibium salinum TaxID=1604349 RepID=UPI0036194F9E